MNYGIHYSSSFGLFAGPIGIFMFEFVQRFIDFFYRKITNTADDEEFLHTFYNIGSFVICNTTMFFIFHSLYPKVAHIPFSFWFLMILLVIVSSLISDINLITVFFLNGDLKTFKEAISFIKTRDMLDMGKMAFSNGLLYLLLLEERWEMIIALFILNYIVSRSFMEKHQSMQHKVERDKFEQMAYTDFLTEVYNRAFMDKTMDSLNNADEFIGVIVADIDSFKKINDTYNHAVGDLAIQHFAATIQGQLDDKDYLFRSGGEEFTIFLRGRSYVECVDLVEQIRASVSAARIKAEYKSQQINIQLTASFGMYYYKTCEELEMNKAYIYADQLLFESKKYGKNRVTAKNGLLDLPISERINLGN